MFQFSCYIFAFLSAFCLSNWSPQITQILMLYQSNVATLMPFSKEDNFDQKCV